MSSVYIYNRSKLHTNFIPIFFFQVRLPPNTSDDVDEDPTGNKALWDRGLLNGASQKVEVSATLIITQYLMTHRSRKLLARPLALSCPNRLFLIVFVCLVGFAVAVLLARTHRPAPQNIWLESMPCSGSETSAANLVLSPEIIMCRLVAWKCLGGHKGKSLFAHQ